MVSLNHSGARLTGVYQLHAGKCVDFKIKLSTLPLLVTETANHVSH